MGRDSPEGQRISDLGVAVSVWFYHWVWMRRAVIINEVPHTLQFETIYAREYSESGSIYQCRSYYQLY